MRKALKAEIADLLINDTKKVVKKRSTKSFQLDDDHEIISPSRASTAPSAANNT